MKKNLYLVIPIVTIILSELVVRVFHGFTQQYFFAFFFSTSVLLLIDVVFHNKTFKKTLIHIVVFLTIVGGGFVSSYYSAFDTIVTFGHLGKAGDFSGILVIIPEYINIDTILFITLLVSYFILMRRVIIQSKVLKRKVIILVVSFVIVLGFNYEVLATKVKQPIFERYGILFYISYDVIHLKDEVMISKEELKKIIGAKEETIINNAMSGVFEGKNLIVVMVESLDDHVIDEYLPTLSALKETGIYFDQYYVPRYQAVTADSEFIYNTSLIPVLKNGTTFTKYQNNSYNISLASLFTDKGYKTYYFHDYYGSFYNRENAIQGLGFDQIFFAEDLGIEVDKGMIEMPKDIDMIKSSLTKIDPEHPFYCFYTTISGHQKYERPTTKEYADYYKSVVESKHDDIFPYYLAAIRLSDDAIDEMLLQLEKQQLIDETVIVITSDHSAKKTGNDIVQKSEESPHLSFKGPLIIWTPGLDRKTVNTISSSFDVLPTLANMFSLNYDPNNYVGKDIFNQGERFIPFYDKQWMTDNGYYDAPRQNYISFAGKSENIKNYSEKLIEVQEVGQAILKYNYYQIK